MNQEDLMINFNGDFQDGIYSDSFSNQSYKKEFKMKEKSVFEKIDDVISTGRDICTIVGAATIMYYGIKGVIFIKESFTNHIKGKDNDKNKRYSSNISDAEFEVIDGEE